MTDFTDQKGTRFKDFQTPCGFEVVLMRQKSGEIEAKFYFEHVLVDNDVAVSRLAPESIRMLEAKMKEIQL